MQSIFINRLWDAGFESVDKEKLILKNLGTSKYNLLSIMHPSANVHTNQLPFSSDTKGGNLKKYL